MVGHGDVGLEETGKHLSPTRIRLFRLVADRGVAQDEDGGNLHLGDFQGAEAGTRPVQFEREAIVPGPRLVGRLAGDFEANLAPTGDFRRPHIDDEILCYDLSRSGADLLQHQAAQLGFHRGRGFAPGIAQRDGHLVVSLWNVSGKEKRRIACAEAGPAMLNRSDFGALFKAVAQVFGIDRFGQYPYVSRRCLPRSEGELVNWLMNRLTFGFARQAARPNK